MVSVQNRSGASHVVLTEAEAVRRAGISPKDAQRLGLLGGFYLPTSGYGTEFKIEGVDARLESGEDADYGSLEIRYSDVNLDLNFVPRKPVPVKAGKREKDRLERHLTRLEVDPIVRRALLDTPGRTEILTLHPERAEHEDGGPKKGAKLFYGYRILGSRALDQSKVEQRKTADRLQALIRASVLAHPDTTVADCFEPRHGLRIHSAAGKIDIVICFACWQGHAYKDGKEIERTVYLKNYFEPQFSKVCRDLGLKVAK